MASEWIGNLPLEFYRAPDKARLLVSSRKEANEIIMWYNGYAPAYVGLGVWRLKVQSTGAGTYELRAVKDGG